MEELSLYLSGTYSPQILSLPASQNFTKSMIADFGLFNRKLKATTLAYF